MLFLYLYRLPSRRQLLTKTVIRWWKHGSRD
nr:MAG TPA: hypothetical protein [Bacteriophage sp.]DAR47869.1 MAG TPA: hypothetical protein [Bacteriophage sp.]